MCMYPTDFNRTIRFVKKQEKETHELKVIEDKNAEVQVVRKGVTAQTIIRESRIKNRVWNINIEIFKLNPEIIQQIWKLNCTNQKGDRRTCVFYLSIMKNFTETDD